VREIARTAIWQATDVIMEIMQHVTINTSYYCERPKADGPVIVLTTGAYKVAEFDHRSGNFNWHRVVPALQKAIIENWVSSRFSQSVSLELASESKSTATPVKKLTRHAHA
jgi:hypothetical protein